MIISKPARNSQLKRKQRQQSARQKRHRRPPHQIHDLAGLFQIALQRHQAGELHQAEAIYRDILKRYPNHPDAVHLLGVIAGQTGKFRMALELINQAIGLNAHVPDYHNNLGKVLQGLDRVDAAIQCYRRALEIKPDHVDAYLNLGNALKSRGQFDGAVACFEKAVQIKPGYFDAYLSMGNALQAQGKLDAAVSAYQMALHINPNDATTHYNLGVVLERLRQIKTAMGCYEKALQLNPGYVEAHNNLGNMLGALGKRDAALRSYEQALAYKPDYAPAYRNLALVKEYSADDDEDIQRIESLLERINLDADDAIHLHFAAGKMYDDCGAYEKAFAHYQRGNELKRKKVNFDAKAFEDFVTRIMHTFTRDLFDTRASFQDLSEIPVFIVGMPRSGTTLVEQIIATHPEACGAGELTYFERSIEMLPKQLQSNSAYPECIALLDHATCQLITEGYMHILRTHCDTALRITDKLPSNFLHLGLIALLFPKARIIHCARKPLDTCLSIYTQYFSTGISYAYALSDIGKYYRQYERLMAHWRETLNSPMLDVGYEELVIDQERTSHKIIEFLALEWDERCLSFYETDRPVFTASNWQVRRPMYARSIGRWKNYDTFLGPLKEQLGIEGGRGN